MLENRASRRFAASVEAHPKRYRSVGAARAGEDERFRAMLPRGLRLGTERRNGSEIRHCHAMNDDRGVRPGRKNGERENSRGCQARTPFPAMAPARYACRSSSHVGLPPLLIASLRDERDDAFDLSFAANCRKATPAGRNVLAIGMALRVARLSKGDRTRQYLRLSAVRSSLHESFSSFITCRNVFIARQTRCRTASALVPRICAASEDEYPA